MDQSSYFGPVYGSIDLKLGMYLGTNGIYWFQCKFGVSWQKKFDFGEFKKKVWFQIFDKNGQIDPKFGPDVGQNISKIRPKMVKNSMAFLCNKKFPGWFYLENTPNTIFTN